MTQTRTCPGCDSRPAGVLLALCGGCQGRLRAGLLSELKAAVAAHIRGVGDSADVADVVDRCVREIKSVN